MCTLSSVTYDKRRKKYKVIIMTSFAIVDGAKVYTVVIFRGFNGVGRNKIRI